MEDTKVNRAVRYTEGQFKIIECEVPKPAKN